MPTRFALILAMLMMLVVSRPTAAEEAWAWSVQRVADNGVKTCRRPMAVGLFDEKAGERGGTFVCWSGPRMQPQVAAFDHATATWGEPRGLDVGGGSSDFHDYPHLVQGRDGRLHVFYSRHNRALYHLAAPEPHSIDGAWTHREIGRRLRATYPMPVVSDDGTLFVFYRITRGEDELPLAYVVSGDGGETWSDPAPAIDHADTRREDHLDEIYAGSLTPGRHPRLGAGAHIAWTLAGGGPERHDHDDYHKNVYHAFFRFADRRWYAADETDLGESIDAREADGRCLVFDSAPLEHKRGGGAYRQDIGYTPEAAPLPDGRVAVVFGDGKRERIGVAVWTGQAWRVTYPDELGDRRDFEDLTVDADGTLRLLLRAGGDAEARGGSDRVAVYTSADAGTAWTLHARTAPTDRPINRAYFIDRARPEASLLLQEINGGDYRGAGYAGEYHVWAAGL